MPTTKHLPALRSTQPSQLEFWAGGHASPGNTDSNDAWTSLMGQLWMTSDPDSSDDFTSCAPPLPVESLLPSIQETTIGYQKFFEKRGMKPPKVSSITLNPEIYEYVKYLHEEHLL